MRDDDGPVIGFGRFMLEVACHYWPAVLVGGLIGFGVASAVRAARDEELIERLGNERVLRLAEETRARRAMSESREARLELDRVRRAWMRDRAEWWKVPGLPVDEAEPERIPPQGVPLVVVPPPETLGIDPK